MQIIFPFESSKTVSAQASITTNYPAQIMFSYIGEQFFQNYPKWAIEVIDFQPLDGKTMQVGNKAKQIREENGMPVESIFEIIEYQPNVKLVLQGIADPYKQTYLIEALTPKTSSLTFRFELLKLELFMQPFQKLIRAAIEEGVNYTVENIKQLIDNEYQ